MRDFFFGGLAVSIGGCSASVSLTMCSGLGGVDFLFDLLSILSVGKSSTPSIMASELTLTGLRGVRDFRFDAMTLDSSPGVADILGVAKIELSLMLVSHSINDEISASLPDVVVCLLSSDFTFVLFLRFIAFGGGGDKGGGE